MEEFQREAMEIIEDNEWEEVEEQAWDDVDGGEIPLSKVAEARGEEVEFMVGKRIWDEVPEKESWDKTGKVPVSVRWVDTNKGSRDNMVIRSRLVARDFEGKDNKRDDLFAETPPREAKRMLFSGSVTRRKDGPYRKTHVY